MIFEHGSVRCSMLFGTDFTFAFDSDWPFRDAQENANGRVPLSLTNLEQPQAIKYALNKGARVGR